MDYDTKYASERSNVFYPNPIFFCGEEIPLLEPDIQDRFKKELDYYLKYKANTRLLIKRAHKWFPKIEKILAQNKMPTDLKYLVAVESAFTNVTSVKGASGFWQIRTLTGRTLGLTVNNDVDERLNPIKATHAASGYFKLAYRTFKNWTLSAASYNMGISGLKRQLKRQEADSYYDLKLNTETARYVFKAMAFKEVFDQQEKYKVQPIIISNAQPERNLKSYKVIESIEDLDAFAIANFTHPDSIKKYNPWVIGNRIEAEKNKEITLYFPRVKPLLQEESTITASQKNNRKQIESAGINMEK
ncbi:MAG: lytic transglycosylase domain-containing protein [Bacteroidota bacterium]